MRRGGSKTHSGVTRSLPTRAGYCHTPADLAHKGWPCGCGDTKGFVRETFDASDKLSKT